MFCSKCGKQLKDEMQFCPFCGNKAGEASSSGISHEPRIMLDPSEVVPHKEVPDSSRSLAGQGKTIGLILMILSIVMDLAGMMLIGFDAFIPFTIAATAMFVIGFLIRMFCP